MSHNNDSHASQHATAPHPAPSSGPRIQPSTSGHVRKASELDTEEGIPTPPTKKSRIASPDHELNLSIKAQGSLPRRTSFLADLYASIRSFGSLSRLWASETRLHVTTILSIPKTSPANYASRLLLARESSASGSSVATPGLALQVDVDEASMSLDPLAGDEVSVRPPTRRLEEAAPEQNHSQPSTHPPNGSANSNTPQSDLDWTLLTRFGIPPGSDLTKLPSSEAIALLNQIYIHLQNHAPGSDQYPQTLRLLQDCCFYTSTLPTAFTINNITFKRTDRIGRGGDALVYRGQMAGHAGTVVVRELVGATYQQKQAIRREWIQLLHREAITHSQLQHPNVLPFWGIYYEDDESYPLMVLPYLERGSLEEIINSAEQRLIDSSVLTTIVVGMARGVVYLHSRTPPIIHGDLHPGNILIDELNNPVLCDFGRSRIRHEVSRHLSTREEGGRIRFLAPELLNGQTDRFCSSPESDVFGLAMTYLNAWTGQPPFAEIKNELRVALVINKGERPIEPTLAVTLDPMIKTDFWKLLVDMWTHDLVQRPPSFRVLERVEQIFDNWRPHFPSGELCLPSLRSLSGSQMATSSGDSLGPTVAVDRLERDKTHKWLAPADPNVNQEERLKQGAKVPNHAKWLFDHQLFQNWLHTPTGFFWVSASAGVGKSVLCSQVVKYLQRHPSVSSAALAFFYFDYRDPEKEVFKKFLASSVEKLAYSSPHCKDILQLSEKSTPYASEEELQDIFHRMLKTPGRKFLVIDAIDECQKSERSDSFLPFLRDLTQRSRRDDWDLRIFVTSRPEPDITQIFDPSDGKGPRLASHRLRLGEQPEHRTTIAALINVELDGPRFRGLGWSEDDFNYVKKELFAKSDSMILWVHLQLLELDQCTGHEAREMLLTLPTSLDQTYARILGRIAPRRRRAVLAVLECMIAAQRSLTVQQIQEILLFQLNCLDEQPRCLHLASTHHSLSANIGSLDISKLLPSLVKLRQSPSTTPSPTTSVDFIHFSVREYLLSNHKSSPAPLSEIAEPSSTSNLNAVGTSLAKARATFSVILLSALDEENSVALPQLSQYATEVWFIYAKLAQYADIAPALAHFLDPGSHSFHHWAQRFYGLFGGSGDGLDHPLHWAVRLGSLDEVKRILALKEQTVDQGTDIRNALDRNGWTPVCYAARTGNIAILSHLLQANTGWTTQWVGLKGESTVLHLAIQPRPQGSDLGALKVLLWPVNIETKRLPDLPIFRCLCGSASPTDIFRPNKHGHSPLLELFNIHSSAKYDVLGFLLEKGADPNTRDSQGSGLIHMAARDGASTAFIHALVHKYGLDIDMVDHQGRTPLFLACETVFETRLGVTALISERINSFLDEKGNINAADSRGYTALDRVLKQVYTVLNAYMYESIAQDRFSLQAPSARVLDAAELVKIVKQHFDIIEQLGGRLRRRMTPHGPSGRWAALRLGADPLRWLEIYEDGSDRLETYMKRIQ